MKRLYFYLILLIIGIFLWINFFSLKNEMKDKFIPATYNNLFSAPQENLGYIKEKIKVSDEIDLDFPFPLNKMYKVEDGHNYLYTLSYRTSKIPLKIGSTLQQSEENEVSDLVNLIFRESYPNVTLEEMGVSSIEEAYQATQLAIWEVAWRAGDSLYGSEYSFIESIKHDIGINSKTEKVIKKAEDLVRLAEQYFHKDSSVEKIYMRTSFIVNTQSANLGYKDGRAWFGPYYYRVENGNIYSADIELEDIEGNASTYVNIVDEKNNLITDFKSAQLTPIYVSIPEDHLSENFLLKVNFKAIPSKILGSIYNDGTFDYVINYNYVFEDQTIIPITINYDINKN